MFYFDLEHFQSIAILSDKLRMPFSVKTFIPTDTPPFEATFLRPTQLQNMHNQIYFHSNSALELVMVQR